MFPSYRNQSIDLQGKSIDWFLYMKWTLDVNGFNYWSCIHLSGKPGIYLIGLDLIENFH